MALFQRMTIVMRGTAYGTATGGACGALAGGALALVPGVTSADALRRLVVVALFGAVFGAVIGLGAGTVGGLAFALAAPWLVRRPGVTRLAGAAVVPGLLIAGWLLWRTIDGRPLIPDTAALPVVGAVFFLLAWVGGPAGALMAPLVLHGHGRPDQRRSDPPWTAPARRSPDRPGGTDAVS